MEAFKTLVESNDLTFVNGNANYESLYKLWTTDEMFDTSKSSGLELNYIGMYYQLVKNYPQMKRYYLMAIDLGDSEAMLNLGLYYQDIEVDPELMKQYYLMVIEKGNSTAMNNLGYYYECTEVDPELMKMYYFMAIERGNSAAMFNLGHYYRYIEPIYKLMKRYYLMAIERGIWLVYHNFYKINKLIY